MARKASRLKLQVARTAIHGQPNLFVVCNILGAVPLPAIACRVRDAVKLSDTPADSADGTMQALMRLGSTLMPAVSIAMTYGLAAAVEDKPRQDSFDGTMMLTQKAAKK